MHKAARAQVGSREVIKKGKFRDEHRAVKQLSCFPFSGSLNFDIFLPLAPGVSDRRSSFSFTQNTPNIPPHPRQLIFAAIKHAQLAR